MAQYLNGKYYNMMDSTEEGVTDLESGKFLQKN